MTSREESGTARIAIEGGWVVTGDADAPWLEQGHVVIGHDGRITAVGAGPSPVRAERVIDASGKIASPGFVNAHTHLCMTLGRTLGVDESLLSWLGDSQVPLMSVFEPEDYALAVQLGALENLKAGNTTVCEVFFSNRFADGADELAVAAIEALGLRSTFYRCSSDLAFAPGFIEDVDDIDRRSRQLVSSWSSSARTGIGVGPLVPWSATRDYWDQTRSMLEAGVPVHLHTSETEAYNDLVREQTGLSNVELLADVGVLGPATMLNHCVHVSETDIKLIADSGAPIIHDPTSNMILASGVAPIREIGEAGITMGLGCDGPACNNTQDMFAVMKDASLLQKVTRRDPKALVALDVFAMATSQGAEAAGFGGEVGDLRRDTRQTYF